MHSIGTDMSPNSHPVDSGVAARVDVAPTIQFGSIGTLEMSDIQADSPMPIDVGGGRTKKATYKPKEFKPDPRNLNELRELLANAIVNHNAKLQVLGCAKHIRGISAESRTEFQSTMLTKIEEAFPQIKQTRSNHQGQEQNTTTQPTFTKATREKAPAMSASPEEWIQYWSRHNNCTVCGVRPLDGNGKPNGSPSVESTRAHLTINRLAPIISRGEDDRRHMFFDHAVQIFAIPNKYQHLIEEHDITINEERSYVALVTEQQVLNPTIVAKHLAANGVTTIDALLFKDFAQAFIQESVATVDPPTLSPYYPFLQQIKGIADTQLNTL
jgi:hypothetical protein